MSKFRDRSVYFSITRVKGLPFTTLMAISADNKFIIFMPPHRIKPGAYNFSVFHTWVRAYECASFCTNVCTYVRDPVRLRLRHLYQVEFCSFIVRYPTAGAFVYCGHIYSFPNFPKKKNQKKKKKQDLTFHANCLQ